MTTHDTPEGKPTSLKKSILLEGFQSIGGTSRAKAAGGRFQRGNSHLVEAHQKDKGIGQELAYFPLHYSFFL